MFDDRSHAGRVLAGLVARDVGDSPLVVLALPRGGVPVGLEVAKRVKSVTDFDVFVVRKLGVPYREELAFGAIATGGVRVLNHSIVEQLRVSDETIERVAQQEQFELQRREEMYRKGRPPTALRDRTIILVDDGLATGASMIAAVRAARMQQPKRIVVAVPVASTQAVEDLRTVADLVICAETHEAFYAVGYWYRDFDQVSDEEVRDLLNRFGAAVPRRQPAGNA